MRGFQFGGFTRPSWLDHQEAVLDLSEAKAKRPWQASEGVPCYLRDDYTPADQDAESCGGPCQCSAQQDANDYADRMQHDRDEAALAACIGRHPAGKDLPAKVDVVGLGAGLAHDVAAYWLRQHLTVSYWQGGTVHVVRFDDAGMAAIRAALGVSR